jgi:hypothetical protein
MTSRIGPIVHFIMQRKQLLGIASRAERWRDVCDSFPKEASMRSRIFGSSLMLVIVLAVGTLATRGDATPARQWAVTWLSQPTLVGYTIVQGPVLIVHDEDAMMRGEPCTRVYLFEPDSGPADEVTAFHCIPVDRKVARKLTITTRANTEIGYGCVLTEYQFAGDKVGHRVPLWDLAH